MAQGNDGKGKGALSVDKRDDGVAIVWMDVPGEEMNTLKDSFADEFGEVFADLERDAKVRGIVFASKKKDNFLAGADISMLQKAETAQQATELARQGQRAMNRVAGLDKPVVAAIHGACLGGGLELAMACHARVATDDRKTKLGQPEVQLGLLPGAGGTQRLPRLVGLQQSLDLMLTGKQVPANKALKMGLVDEVVRRSILVEVAAGHAKRLAEAEPTKQKPIDRLREFFQGDELKELAMAENPVGRKVVFDQARKATLKQTKGNYPAPEKILEVVRVGLEKGFEAGLDAEAAGFGELVVSPEAAQLINIFFAQRELKQDPGVDDPSVEPREVKKVGMLGAGLMGAGIAYITADSAGIPVRLRDKDDQGLRWGLKYVRDIVDKRVGRKRMTPQEGDRLMYQIEGTTGYSGFDHCDVVIEAVFEDLELKRKVVKELEEQSARAAATTGKQDNAADDVIFASNTSSLPIGQIAEASKHPENVIGMHYFSPVHKMPLLEIITTDKTSPEVTATCVELGKKQGKTVIVVRDGVGFYTSRILAPFMNEAFHILSEGAYIDCIDMSVTKFGFPVGPIKLTDEVGIDVGAKVGKIMQDAYGERLTAPPGMDKLLADDRKGRKNGRGFYRYDDKKGVDESIYGVLGLTPKDGAVAPDDIAWRCTLQMVNEAARCYGEGILRTARDGDVGAIFGLGFPPFRGGPFRFVDAVGPKEILRRLEQYQSRYGVRFEPAPVLRQMAEQGLTFHGEKRPTPGEAPSEKPARPQPRA